MDKKLKDSLDWREWLDQQSEDAVVDYLMMQDNNNTRLLTENHNLKGELYRVKARLRDALGLLNKARLTLDDCDLHYFAGEIQDFLAKGGDHDRP